MKYPAILTTLLVLASYTATTYAQPVTPLAPGPEVDAFKKALDALLKKYGVTAKSRYVKLKKPALTAHVLEAGRGEPLLLRYARHRTERGRAVQRRGRASTPLAPD